MRVVQIGWLVAAVFFAILPINVVETQERRALVSVSPAVSKSILDRIFPRWPTRDTRIAYSIVVRIVADDELETQDSIHVSPASAVEARRARVLHEPASSTALRFKQKSDREDVDEIARLIQVDRRDIAMNSSEARTWQESLLVAFEATTKHMAAEARRHHETGDTRVVLDGTLYEIWYKQDMVDWHLSFWDADLGGSSELFPMTKWIRAFDKRFERQ